MFDIAQVELENFRSYRGPHKFEIPVDPGLYLITGKNEVEPRLGPNGVGKSTLLDAIYWCLYGKTTRGLKAGDVIAWGQTQCSVTVYLTVSDKAIKITRTQSPNSLTLDDTAVTQETIQKHLRLGPEAFTYAVLLPQFGESFFDLLPSAKLTLFSQIMELDYWLEKSDEAQTLAAEIDGARNQNNNIISRLRGQLEVEARDIYDYTKLKVEFAATQAALVAEQKQKLTEVLKESKAANEVIQFNAKALMNIEDKLAKLKGRLTKCPKCGQPIADLELDGLLGNKDDFERQAMRAAQDRATCAVQEKNIRRTIEAETNRSNPYAEQLKQKQASHAACEKRIGSLNRENEGLDEDHAAVSYWINGFKRIRLFIVEQALRQLEIEVNNNMSSLGLTDWRVEFDVERENKSGGVTKGFVVFVYAPGHSEPVRLEAWSGGETQRLRLAGSLGLANLIMEQAGLRNTIEFYDEPSRHLSQEGLLDVAETLHQRALLGHKRIFLVDHATIDFGDFANVFFIVKTPAGSRLTLTA
jgi:DNA repair exonuclease SbcCD ATPase subunit